MTMIADNLQRVHKAMAAACVACGRDTTSVRLLAVSKTFGADAVRAAHAAGQMAFGENYVQEAVAKMEALADLRKQIEWHLIGPLQSNKTRVVAELFDWVQSVDRLKIAQRLSEQRPAHLQPLQVCLQVNIDGGANKSGVSAGDLLPLAREVARLPGLRLRGIMGIPEPSADFETACAVFTQIKVLFDQVHKEHPHADTLSMGMSADWQAAICSGSSMVRLGTAVFGDRVYV
ncbi:MAG: hypothetical protein RLZZ126_1563 [Pseudomonadota bacterium]|jgi:pyridoxal phosphate enzyme (YggS family)